VIEKELHAWLIANIAVVAGRVYARKLPQEPTLPALTFTRISGIPWPTHDGPVGKSDSRFQISCWALEKKSGGTGYLGAKELAEDLRQALDCFTGVMGAETIEACFCLNMVDLGDDEAELQQVAVDFLITHTEA
jgi:hypothetical protein